MKKKRLVKKYAKLEQRFDEYRKTYLSVCNDNLLFKSQLKKFADYENLYADLSKANKEIDTLQKTIKYLSQDINKSNNKAADYLMKLRKHTTLTDQEINTLTPDEVDNKIDLSVRNSEKFKEEFTKHIKTAPLSNISQFFNRTLP